MRYYLINFLMKLVSYVKVFGMFVAACDRVYYVCQRYLVLYSTGRFHFWEGFNE